MIIAADRNIPFVEQACEGLGSVRLFDVREAAEAQAALAGAEVLLCRSTLHVDAALLEGSAVRFVATATSGTDHMELDWLEAAGIAWAAADGSNARSVAEWLAAVLLELHSRKRTDLVGADIGIVGIGHVGTQVADIARALGLRAVLNDPPRQQRGEKPLSWGDIPFSPLDELLHCRILTLHTPLTSAPPYPTRRLFGERRLALMSEAATVINAARGEVLDAEAALTWRRWGQGALALDVYHGEPGIDPALVAVADIATPHVAGHALDGKLRGTQMVHDALCRFLDVTHDWDHTRHLPPAADVRYDRGQLRAARSPYEELRIVVGAIVPLLADDAALRRSMELPHERRADAFKTLRADYSIRREFACMRVSRSDFSTEAAHMLDALGFQLS
jgi:erythronate-4-phosphate dehydrogenase